MVHKVKHDSVGRRPFLFNECSGLCESMVDVVKTKTKQVIGGVDIGGIVLVGHCIIELNKAILCLGLWRGCMNGINKVLPKVVVCVIEAFKLLGQHVDCLNMRVVTPSHFLEGQMMNVFLEVDNLSVEMGATVVIMTFLGIVI